MNLIDMHCDTFWKLSEQKTDLCVDAEKLKKAGSILQFFAAFIYTKGEYQGTFEKALDMISMGKKYVKENEISALLTVEEGGILEGKIERLNRLWEEDIRLLTLLWNYENCIGYPNSRDKKVMEKGLKPFGFDVIERMNELGMLIDVSHMSDGGFWDVIRHSNKPIVASHSNARSLCNHPRNLTDEMIRAIAEKGGVVGVNFYPYFVNENGVATADHIVLHMKYMLNVGGEDVVAIGTDFDGFDEGTLEISHMGQMELLYEAMRKAGIPSRQMDKICCENVLRVLGNCGIK